MRGSKDNTTLFIVIGIFAFAIIVGTIIGSSYNYNERFTVNKNKLVYLYMEGCGHCKEFNSVWDNIKNKVDNDKTKYPFSADKLDLAKEGSEYANKYNIEYAPAILFIKEGSTNKNEYNGSRTVEKVLEWAIKQNN